MPGNKTLSDESVSQGTRTKTEEKEIEEGKMLTRFSWWFSTPSIHLNMINWPEGKGNRQCTSKKTAGNFSSFW